MSEPSPNGVSPWRLDYYSPLWDDGIISSKKTNVKGILTKMVRPRRLELPRISPQAPQACVSTNSTMVATFLFYQTFFQKARTIVFLKKSCRIFYRILFQFLADTTISTIRIFLCTCTSPASQSIRTPLRCLF